MVIMGKGSEKAANGKTAWWILVVSIDEKRG